MSVGVGDDNRFWRAAAVVFAVVSVLKGLRPPSLWAATQANLDYHHGFVKRGLFGQLAHSLGVAIGHYDVFVIVSGVLLLMMLTVLGWWVVRSGALRLENGMMVAVFGASFALTYLTHLIGYLEIPLAIVALLAMSIGTSRARLPAIFIAGCFGVLIHESYVLTFLPMTLLPPLLAALAGRDRPALLSIAAVVGAIAIALLSVALGHPLTPHDAGGMQASMAAAVDFRTRDDFFPVLTRSAADNVTVMSGTMSNGLWWLAQCNAFVTFMPTAALFLWIALDLIGKNEPPSQRFLLQAAVLTAGLSPLLMQFLGWDIYRWYALAAFSSFVSMTVVHRHYGKTAAPVGVRNAAILLIGINMATGTGLFDGFHVNTFPFVDFWKSVIHWVASGGHFTQPDA